MSKVRIITDSDAYLPQEVLSRYDIEVIPHRLKVGGSFYEEDSDFTADDLFRTLSDAQQAGMNTVPELQAPPSIRFSTISKATTTASPSSPSI